MSERPNTDFLNILSQSGVPITADEMETELKTAVSDAGSILSNDSQMSPFWRWVRAAVITPVLWLTRTLLVSHVLPNMFVATAERWALELKGWELNITPKAAVKTQGYVTFTKDNAVDEVTVEQGAVVQTLAIDTVIYKMIVVEDTPIAAGQASGKVLVEAEHAGAAYNLTAGYFNILPQEIPGIASIVNEAGWITRLGADEESDEALALRLQNAFTSAGQWHIDDVYRAIITDVAGIRSDLVFFRNTGQVTPGTAEALILVEVGETPQSVLDTLNQYIMDEGHHGHGDILTCKAIPDTLHDVVAEVALTDNLSDTQIAEALAEAEARIRAAFRQSAAYAEMTRATPNSRFSLSQLESEIHTHMDDVTSVRLTVDGSIQADIVSELTQPRLQSLTVKEMRDA
jgi:hypothetical protein